MMDTSLSRRSSLLCLLGAGALGLQLTLSVGVARADDWFSEPRQPAPVAEGATDRDAWWLASSTVPGDAALDQQVQYARTIPPTADEVVRSGDVTSYPEPRDR